MTKMAWIVAAKRNRFSISIVADANCGAAWNAVLDVAIDREHAGLLRYMQLDLAVMTVVIEPVGDNDHRFDAVHLDILHVFDLILANDAVCAFDEEDASDLIVCDDLERDVI